MLQKRRNIAVSLVYNTEILIIFVFDYVKSSTYWIVSNTIKSKLSNSKLTCDKLKSQHLLHIFFTKVLHLFF